MMQHKRSPVSVDQSNFMNLMPKRLKTDVPNLPSKEKKEKVSERISALQQLVSPYGKTDTASVLLEAVEYINFLHEQVKVLVAPYFYGESTQIPDTAESSLKGKGLCVVPVSFTAGVVSNNGADIWAPIKTGTSNSRTMSSDETLLITRSQFYDI